MKIPEEVKIRKEGNGLMYFNSETAHTTILGENGVEAIIDRLKGGNPKVPSGFVGHLYKSGLLERSSIAEDRKETLITLEEFMEAKPPKAPLRSLSSPETVHISISKTCNQSCAGCFYSYRNITDEEAFLDLKTYKKIIRQAADMGVFQVSIGGGEALMHTDIEEMIAYAQDFQVLPSVTTNGSLLQKDFLKNLVKTGYGQLQFSLNGSTAEVHGQTRPNYNKVRKAMKMAREHGVRYGVNFLTTRTNLRDLNATTRLAAQEGAHTVNILRPKPDVRSTSWLQRSSPGSVFYNRMLDHIRDAQHIADRVGTGTSVTIDGSLSFLLTQQYSVEQMQRMGAWGCTAGRRFLTVDADANVLPCSHVPDQYDVSSGDIKKAWFESKAFERFRHLEETIKGQCQTCEYKPVCKGCRVVARNYLGTLEDEDPECPYYSSQAKPDHISLPTID